MAEGSSGRTWLWLGVAAAAIVIVVVAVGWGVDDPAAPASNDPSAAEPDPPEVLRPLAEPEAAQPDPEAPRGPTNLDPPGALRAPSDPLGMVVSGACRDYETVACGCDDDALCSQARARVRAWMVEGYRSALERCEQYLEPARAACAN